MEVNEIHIELEKGLFGPAEKSAAKAISFLLEHIAALKEENDEKDGGLLALEIQLSDLTAERDRLLLSPSDPASGWQGINKEVKLWQERAKKAEAERDKLRDKITKWAEDHYWDSLTKDRDLIIKHIKEGFAADALKEADHDA